MSLSDDLIEQKKAADAAGERGKVKEKEWAEAVDALLRTIEGLVAQAKEEKAVNVNRGQAPLTGMQVSLPMLTVTPTFRQLMTQPVTIQPVSMSRVEIRGGAVAGQNTVLRWDGSGNELANWSISLPATGPRAARSGANVRGHPSRSSGPALQTLTTEALETVLRRYLGLGAAAFS
jgi:hypothetical protein